MCLTEVWLMLTKINQLRLGKVENFLSCPKFYYVHKQHQTIDERKTMESKCDQTKKN